jgi:hypothetical protein
VRVNSDPFGQRTEPAVHYHHRPVLAHRPEGPRQSSEPLPSGFRLDLA